jgi:hypothetical protein
MMTHIIGVLTYVEVVLALIALALLGKKHALSQYKSLAAILILTPSMTVVFSLLTHYLYSTDRHLLYEIYFYMFWPNSIVEAILIVMFCYVVLTRLFSSLPELRSISTRVFGWIVFFWCAVSARFFFMPHMNAVHLMVAEATQLKLLEGGVSFLTGMVVFVSIRPLRLLLRSRLPAFGLGLIFCAMGIFFDHLSVEFKIALGHWIMILGSGAICAQLISWVAGIVWREPVREVVSV